MEASKQDVEAWKNNPWNRLPTWAKWTLGVVGAFVLLGIGAAAGGSEEGDAQAELDEARTELRQAKRRAAQAEEATQAITDRRDQIVGAAENRATKIVGSARSAASRLDSKLETLRGSISGAEDELANVEGSLSGAEEEQALSHFGEGIVQAEVDFIPGTYKSEGGEGCYWATLNSANTDDIATNEITIDAAQQIVTIDSPYFQSSNCGTWKRTGE